MPFAKRITEPIRLSRDPVDKSYQFDLGIVSNNTLVGALRQLANLVRHADDVFGEVSQECEAIFRRTEKLHGRVSDLSSTVEKFNAKAVKVPEGDLTWYAESSEHYRADHGYDCYLFSPLTRPQCVQELYKSCALSPVAAIRQCNLIRTDGKTGSRLFSRAPVVLDDSFELSDLELEIRKPPASTSFEREHREIREVRSRPASVGALSDLDVQTNAENVELPTPEERLRELSRSMPVTLVPIDVTGSAFDRMCEFRESVRDSSREYLLDESTRDSRKEKRRRRRTLSGLPGFFNDEVYNDYFKVGELSRTRSLSRDRWERPRSLGMDEWILPKKNKKKDKKKDEKRDRSTSSDREDEHIARSCSLRRSLRSLFKGSKSRSRSRDFWVEGRPESPGPPIIDLGRPLQRSQSLPRSLRSLFRRSKSQTINSRSASAEGRLDVEPEDDDIDVHDHVTGKPPKPPQSTKKGPKMRRSRSQHVSQYVSTFMSSDWPKNSGARPKSLDFPPAMVDRGRPVPIPTPTTPSTESIASTSTQDSLTASGSRLNIPTSQSVWADVRLRPNLKGKANKDDRQSSSGNWSGSSSARQSLESESVNSPERRSQVSLDQDSAVSLNIHSLTPSEDSSETISVDSGDLDWWFTTTTDTNNEETSTLNGDTSTLNGDASSTNSSVINVKANFTKLSTDDWLKSVQNGPQELLEKNNIPSQTSSGATTPTLKALSPPTSPELTQQNLRVHDYAHLPYLKNLCLMGDDESSVYSVDQEGFFTSMHKDSGLKRSHADISELAEMESVNSSVQDNVINNEGVSSRRGGKVRKSQSFLSRLPGFKKTVTKKHKTAKGRSPPPPPPPRLSAALDKSNVMLNVMGKDDSNLPPPPSAEELQKLGEAAAYPAPSSKLQPSHRIQFSQLHTKAPSNETVGSNLSSEKSGSTAPSAHAHDSSFESDAETIYARLKQKTSFSSAAYPSLVSVTPVNSDEEDSDMLTMSEAWRGALLKSTKSAPEIMDELNEECSATPRVGTLALDLPANMVGDTNKTPTKEPLSGCSTWPRSPTEVKIGGILKDSDKAVPPRPPRTLNFAPTVNLYNPHDAQGTKTVLPEPQTPDDMGYRSPMSRSNSFRSPSDSSTPQEPQGDFNGLPVLSSFRSSASINSSLSSASNPSISSDEVAPDLPSKYRHSIKVMPGTRSSHKSSKHGKHSSKGSHKVQPVLSPTQPPQHVYANVIIQNPTPKGPYPSQPVLGGPDPLSRQYAMPVTMTPASAGAGPTIYYASSNTVTPGVHSSQPDVVPTQGRVTPSSMHKPTSLPVSPTEMAGSPAYRPSSLPVSPTGIMAASARLIISSPMSTRASHVENPYKRSVCSPVTTEELLNFSNYNNNDTWYNTLRRKSNNYKPPRPNLSGAAGNPAGTMPISPIHAASPMMPAVYTTLPEQVLSPSLSDSGFTSLTSVGAPNISPVTVKQIMSPTVSQVPNLSPVNEATGSETESSTPVASPTYQVGHMGTFPRSSAKKSPSSPEYMHPNSTCTLPKHSSAFQKVESSSLKHSQSFPVSLRDKTHYRSWYDGIKDGDKSQFSSTDSIGNPKAKNRLSWSAAFEKSSQIDIVEILKRNNTDVSVDAESETGVETAQTDGKGTAKPRRPSLKSDKGPFFKPISPATVLPQSLTVSSKTPQLEEKDAVPLISAQKGKTNIPAANIVSTTPVRTTDQQLAGKPGRPSLASGPTATPATMGSTPTHPKVNILETSKSSSCVAASVNMRKKSAPAAVPPRRDSRLSCGGTSVVVSPLVQGTSVTSMTSNTVTSTSCGGSTTATTASTSNVLSTASASISSATMTTQSCMNKTSSSHVSDTSVSANSASSHNKTVCSNLLPKNKIEHTQCTTTSLSVASTSSSTVSMAATACNKTTVTMATVGVMSANVSVPVSAADDVSATVTKTTNVANASTAVSMVSSVSSTSSVVYSKPVVVTVPSTTDLTKPKMTLPALKSFQPSFTSRRAESTKVLQDKNKGQSSTSEMKSQSTVAAKSQTQAKEKSVSGPEIKSDKGKAGSGVSECNKVGTQPNTKSRLEPQDTKPLNNGNRKSWHGTLHPIDLSCAPVKEDRSSSVSSQTTPGTPTTPGRLSLGSSQSSLCRSSTSLAKSCGSLNKSTESIGSQNSVHSDKMRAAKLAFLQSETETPQKVANDPFAKYKVKSKPPNGSTAKDTPERKTCSSSALNRVSSGDSGSKSSSEHVGNRSPSVGSEGQAHKMGRFVGCLVKQYHKRSMESLSSVSTNGPLTNGSASSANGDMESEESKDSANSKTNGGAASRKPGTASSPKTANGPVTGNSSKSTTSHLKSMLSSQKDKLRTANGSKPTSNGFGTAVAVNEKQFDICNGSGPKYNSSTPNKPGLSKTLPTPKKSVGSPRRKLLADIRNMTPQQQANRAASLAAMEERNAQRRRESSPKEDAGVLSILDSIKLNLKAMRGKHGDEDSSSAKESLNSSSEWD